VNTSLEVAFIGMKASLEQMQCIGDQFAQLASGGTLAVNDMVELVSEGRTFEANAAVVRAADEVLGSVIDLIV
jgi:hypothetical protein